LVKKTPRGTKRKHRGGNPAHDGGVQRGGQMKKHNNHTRGCGGGGGPTAALTMRTGKGVVLLPGGTNGREGKCHVTAKRKLRRLPAREEDCGGRLTPGILDRS